MGHAAPRLLVERAPARKARELWAGANALPYARDRVAQALIGAHGAFNQAEIGAMLGISRQRVQQIVDAALAKLATRLLALGVCRQDCRDLMAARDDEDAEAVLHDVPEDWEDER